jgi:glycosyltransferase involved in cell wall biosynthesis
MRPEVSVIVPVHNRASMAARAIASLRAQTFTDIEIIVVDDGSTDDLHRVVESMSEPRLQIVAHPENRGIPAARNSGLTAASGRYIAWLDSDDQARPERLAIQHAYLESHPDVAMIGSAAGVLRSNGRRKLCARRPPRSHEEIVATLLFRSAFQQSSIIGRSEVLKAYPYRETFPVCEDVDMFIRLTFEHRTANLNQVLVDRTLHAGQSVRAEGRIAEQQKSLARPLLARLGIDASEAELNSHVLLGNIKKTPVDRAFLQWSDAWLARIVSANSAVRVYDEQALRSVIGRIRKKAFRAGQRGPDPIYAIIGGWRTPKWLGR